jgi:sortase B
MNKGSGKNSVRKTILNTLIIIFAAVFALSVYYLVSYLLEGKKAEDEFGKLRYEPTVAATESPGADADADYPQRQAHYQELYGKNKDFVGWLRLYDMPIDYPVMHTPANQDYYLHRNFEKKYSGAGTLFTAAQTDTEKPSDVIIIYGHKMKNGSMFGRLSSLEEKSFYQKHRYIQLDTLKVRRHYVIFRVLKTVVNTGKSDEYRYYDYDDFTDEADFQAFMAESKKKEFFDSGEKVSFGDKILLLSTCEYSRKNSRLLIMAREIAAKDAPVFP